MSKPFKRWRMIGCAALAFLTAILVEDGARALARKPIPIVVDENANAIVEGNVRPDFLWIGDAWFISINCRQAVSVDIDGQWRANLPAGKHEIYHNHDTNNTRKYAGNYWTLPPTIVMVKKL